MCICRACTSVCVCMHACMRIVCTSKPLSFFSLAYYRLTINTLIFTLASPISETGLVSQSYIDLVLNLHFLVFRGIVN